MNEENHERRARGTAHTLSPMMAIAPEYAQLSAEQAATMFPRRPAGDRGGRDDVGVVEVVGVLDKRAYYQAQLAVTALAGNADVSEILIRVDSPGGDVDGAHDLFLAVNRAAQRKSVTAYIDGTGASAAYWAIAGATRIVCGATAQVGSIGVFNVTIDVSENLERDGIRVIVVRTGPTRDKVCGATSSPGCRSSTSSTVSTCWPSISWGVWRGAGEWRPAR